MTAITRGLRRANIRVAVSDGISSQAGFLHSGPPLGTGVAGEREYFDMDVLPPFQAASAREGLNAVLPEGLAVSAMEVIGRQLRRLEQHQEVILTVLPVRGRYCLMCRQVLPDASR